MGHALTWAGATERFVQVVGTSAQLATTPRVGDELAHCMHLWGLGSGWRGYWGDFLRKYVFESGPIARQRWLHRRQYPSVTEVVEKSVAVSPPRDFSSWSK